MKTHSSLRQNERGAILVVGLLAAVLLLGIVWTVMGVGESIAFRERGQTGADAVAFSASVIQARGMNFLVLFNLLMAAILVIRVILRGILIGAWLLSWVPGFGEAAVGTLTDINLEVDPWINRAIDGLGMAGQSVMMMNSSFAMGTGNYVAKAYTPVVSSAIVSSDGVNAGEEGISALPVQADAWGGPLCAKAVGTLGDAFDAILDPMGLGFVKPVKDIVFSPVETIIAALSPIFCGLGMNLPAPKDNIDKALKQQSDACRAQVQNKGLKPGSQEYKNEMKKCDFGGDAYDSSKNTVVMILLNLLQGALDLSPPQSLEVADGWKNGYGQTIAIATLNPALLKGNLALFGVSATTALPKGAGSAVAQSEFYYDCTGRWDDPACNGKKTPLGPGEAMWNFRWRARLVPVDAGCLDGGEECKGSAVVRQFTDPMAADYRSTVAAGGDPQTAQFFQSLSSYVEH
jgi:hypothetical protein